MTAVRVPRRDRDPGRTAAALVVAVAAPPAIVAGAVVLVVAGVLPGVIVVVVAAVTLAGWLWIRASRSVPAQLGGRPADPEDDARLVNVAEGLCTNAGVRLPQLRILDAPALNLAVAGHDPSAAVVVVTSGLLEQLTRIELEGILAAGIVQIRHRDVLPATVAAATGLGVAWAVGRDRDLVVDAAAVRLTRYPPGLRAALEACARCGTAVPGVPPRLVHLWLVDPLGAGGAPVYRRPLAERIDLLSEL